MLYAILKTDLGVEAVEVEGNFDAAWDDPRCIGGAEAQSASAAEAMWCEEK